MKFNQFKYSQLMFLKRIQIDSKLLIELENPTFRNRESI